MKCLAAFPRARGNNQVYQNIHYEKVTRIHQHDIAS